MIEKKSTHETPSAEKKVSSENTFEKVSWKLDEQMDKLMKHWFTEQVLWNKFVKELLESNRINNLSKPLQSLWVIAIFCWIWILFSSFSGFKLFFWRGLGISFFFSSLLYMIFALLSLLVGYGITKYKSRSVLTILAQVATSVLFIIVCVIWWWARVWFGFLLFFVSLIYAITLTKNKELFKN